MLDDLVDEGAQSKEFLALVVAGWHRNVRLTVLRHNLFQQTKTSKAIDLNVTQLILFNSPRDSGQIDIWVVICEGHTPKSKPIKELLNNLMVI